MRKNPLESNINKNNVNAEALEMWSADSAQPCLITVHLGQRPNGRLGCGPRQTTFHLASTARKSWDLTHAGLLVSSVYKMQRQTAKTGDNRGILTNNVSAQVQETTTVVKL